MVTTTWDRRAAAAVLLAVGAAALAPLWLCDFVPAADLPNHVAVSSIVARLLAGGFDPLSSYYELAVPAFPYYLAYGLLVPAVGLLGPVWGARTVLTLVGVLTFVTTAAVLHELKRPWPAFLGGVFLFYSALFFWGFIATAAGLPVALLGLFFLLRHHETRRARYLFGACCAGALTCAAHVLLLPLWAALVLAYCSLSPRRNAAAATLPLAASILPLGPWLISVGKTSAVPDFCLRMFYRGPEVLLYRAKRQFSVFGKGMGRAGHLGFVLFAIVVAVVSRVAARKGAHEGSTSSANRLGGVLVALGLALFLLMPEAADLGPNEAWGINFRYFVLVELGILASIPRPARPAMQRGMAAVLAALAVLFVTGLWGVWRDFERMSAPLKPLLASIPPHRTLTRVTVDPSFGSAWPPLRAHLPAYYVATRGAFDHGVFAGGHVPLRPRLVMRAQSDPAWPLRLGDFDYMIVQGDVAAESLPLDGDLCAEAGAWKLYERRTEACWDSGASEEMLAAERDLRDWILAPLCGAGREGDTALCAGAGEVGVDGGEATEDEILCLEPPLTHELHWNPQRPAPVSQQMPGADDQPVRVSAAQRQPTFEVCF